MADRKRLRQAFSCGPSTIRLLTWCAILNCGFCGLAFAGDLASANPRSAGHVPEVPFKLYQGYVIVVLGRIGNLENQNLLLDTGSYPSLVDKNVCTKLGLQGTPKRLSLFNKNISSEVVLLPDLQFGPVTRRNLPVMVADFAGISGGLRIRIDAVIGVDVLGGTSFTVDYEKHRVLFRPSTERYTVSFYGARAVRNGESKDGWPPTTAAPRYRNAAARLVSEPTEWH